MHSPSFTFGPDEPEQGLGDCQDHHQSRVRGPLLEVNVLHVQTEAGVLQISEVVLDLAASADLTLLDDEELALVRLAAQYPRVVEAAALAHEPHRIAFYLGDLAAALHAQWNKGNDDPARRFLLGHDPDLTRARLELATAIGQIVRNGLGIMGVAAAEEMQ